MRDGYIKISWKMLYCFVLIAAVEMGTHHFNRKNMFHKVRHSTSVLIFRA